MTDRVGFLTADAEVGPAVAVLTELKTVLDTTHYDRTEIVPLQGGPLDLALDPVNLARAARGRSNVLQASAVAGLYRAPLLRRNTEAVWLHRLFSAGEDVPRSRVAQVLSENLVSRLVAARLLTAENDRLRSEVLVTTHRGRLYLSDSLRYRNDPDFCYLGRLSFPAPDLLLDAVRSGRQSPPQRLLDLGCGAGVGAIALSDVADEVVGTDVVPHCVRFARVNAELNDVGNATFDTSDLFAQIEGTFDAVVTHPPGGWSLTTVSVAAADGGGDFGLELPARMIGGALERLRPGGVVAAIVMAPVLRGRPYAPEVLERICADQPADVVLYPLLEYYEYENRVAYLEHGVDKLVRYLAVLRPADRFSIRYERFDTARLLSARIRSLPARAAARLTRRRGP